MKLYTFIADCEGGTFASQHLAENQDCAMLYWIRQIPRQLFKIIYENCDVVDMNLEISRLHEDELRLERTKGLKGVYGGYLSLNEKEIFLFVIETQIES